MMSNQFRFLEDDDEGNSSPSEAENLPALKETNETIPVNAEVLRVDDFEFEDESQYLEFSIALEKSKRLKYKLWQADDKLFRNLDSSNEKVAMNRDVLKGCYEGGFKLWECSEDLVRYIHNSDSFRGLAAFDGDKIALDLGCGHGLLGIYLLEQGFSQVYFQDLNRAVLKNATVRNVSANAGQEALKYCKFVCGDWRNFDCAVSKSVKFDVIVTSETVYDEEMYPAIHDILRKFLAPNGRVYLAAKKYYFGVGGGTYPFRQFIEESNYFQIEKHITLMDGCSNIRQVLEISAMPA